MLYPHYGFPAEPRGVLDWMQFRSRTTIIDHIKPVVALQALRGVVLVCRKGHFAHAGAPFNDPLRPASGTGGKMAARIAESGVSLVAFRALGLGHGFYRHFDDFDAAEVTLRQVAAFLDLHAR